MQKRKTRTGTRPAMLAASVIFGLLSALEPAPPLTGEPRRVASPAERTSALLRVVFRAYRVELDLLRRAPYDEGVSNAPYYEEYTSQPFQWVLTHSLMDPERSLELARKYLADVEAQPSKTPDGKRLVSPGIAHAYALACEILQKSLRGDPRAALESAKNFALEEDPYLVFRGPWDPPILRTLLCIRGTDDYILGGLDRLDAEDAAGNVFEISRTRPALALVFLEVTKLEFCGFFDPPGHFAAALENIGRYVSSQNTDQLRKRFVTVLRTLRKEAEAVEARAARDRSQGHRYWSPARAYAYVALGYHAIGEEERARECLDLALSAQKRFSELVKRFGGRPTCHVLVAALTIAPGQAKKELRRFLDRMYPERLEEPPITTIGHMTDLVYAHDRLLGPAWQEALKRGMRMKLSPGSKRTQNYWLLYSARPYLKDLYARGRILEGLRFFRSVSRRNLDTLADVQRTRLTLLNHSCLGYALARMKHQPGDEQRLTDIEAATRDILASDLERQPGEKN